MRFSTIQRTILYCVLLFTGITIQAEPQAPVTTTIPADQIAEYADCAPEIQSLIDAALALTTMNLGYLYGSANPERGGMDCSGAIHYLLKHKAELPEVPRQANHFYRWVWEESIFRAVNTPKLQGFEWDELQPGDLLFWSGTYEVDRDPPVTHVMLYLGTLKESGKKIMFGASSGRRYETVSQHGVSLFTLDMPREGSSSRFLGYGAIPNLVRPAEPVVEVDTADATD